MVDHLTEAREQIREASETVENSDIRTNLLSIEDGLSEVMGGDKTVDTATPDEEDLKELEEKLDGLKGQIDDDDSRRYVETAREHIEMHRTQR